MGKLDKALQKLSPKEREWVKSILHRLATGDIKGLNIQKLKGTADIFRLRKGDMRLIYRKDAQGKLIVIAIERRSEKTYKF